MSKTDRGVGAQGLHGDEPLGPRGRGAPTPPRAGEMMARNPHWLDGAGVCVECGVLEPDEGSECLARQQEGRDGQSQEPLADGPTNVADTDIGPDMSPTASSGTEQ